MLEDAAPRQSIAAIVASHPNPCAKVKGMKIRKENGKKMHEPCSATQFILKPIAHIEPDDFTDYVDERCQVSSAASWTFSQPFAISPWRLGASISSSTRWMA